MAIRRRRRIEDPVTYLGAVQPQLVVAESRHIGARAPDIARDRELTPQQWHDTSDVAADPRRLPILRPQQAHLEACRRRRTSHLEVSIPELDGPPTVGTTRQRLAAIRHTIDNI